MRCITEFNLLEYIMLRPVMHFMHLRKKVGFFDLHASHITKKHFSDLPSDTPRNNDYPLSHTFINKFRSLWLDVTVDPDVKKILASIPTLPPTTLYSQEETMVRLTEDIQTLTAPFIKITELLGRSYLIKSSWAGHVYTNNNKTLSHLLGLMLRNRGYEVIPHSIQCEIMDTEGMMYLTVNNLLSIPTLDHKAIFVDPDFPGFMKTKQDPALLVYSQQQLIAALPNLKTRMGNEDFINQHMHYENCYKELAYMNTEQINTIDFQPKYTALYTGHKIEPTLYLKGLPTFLAVRDILMPYLTKKGELILIKEKTSCLAAKAV